MLPCVRPERKAERQFQIIHDILDEMHPIRYIEHPVGRTIHHSFYRQTGGFL